MINKIELRGVLPRVFEGAEKEAPVNRSEVWLRDVVFERGKSYLVEAESGTGKSSLCSFIYGNRSDYLGTILFDGRDARTLDIDAWSALRCRSLALLPQEMRLFPELTVRENIDIKNRLTGYASQEQIEGMLDRVELLHKIDVPARLLSIGQQQRVAIIRALCQPMDFVLLDEPVSHLDSRNNAVVAQMIVEAAGACGAGIIATSVGNKILIPNPEVLKL